MYEAPESRAREARGTHRDVGRAHLWWRQRLEGQWWQQEPRLRQQGLEEPRGGLQESQERFEELICICHQAPGATRAPGGFFLTGGGDSRRSGERRVGEEGRSRGVAC